MKKLLLIVVIAMCGINQVHAQIYIGGSVGYTNSKISMGEDGDQSGSSFKILPEIGYQFNNQMAFGVSMGYMKGYAALAPFDVTDIKALGSAIVSTMTDVSSGDMGDLDLKTFRIAPYLRYTIFESGKFQIFIDGIIGLNFIKADASKIANGISGSLGEGELEDDNLKTPKITGLEVCLRPGIALQLTDQCKLFAKIGTVGYQTFKLKDSDFKITRIGLDVDSNSLSLGALFCF